MEINKSAQSEKEGKMPMVAGCSMGAYHAANVFFRRPDLFDTVISMSGFYHLKLIVGDYMDSLVYLNSPYDSIAHLPKEHPYRELYARSTIILCVGQGAWEEELLEETRKFDALLKQQGISAWVDYWGYDVSHDWSWWRKQWIYFLSQVL
jgi:esterase/lipase superfamily enzyme